MSKARTLADFISDGSEFADGTISVAEVSGAAPLASPTFTGNVGVGASPSTVLDVYSSSADADGILRVYQNTATSNPTMQIRQRGEGGSLGTTQGLLIDMAGHNSGLGYAIKATTTNSNLNGGTAFNTFTLQNGGTFNFFAGGVVNENASGVDFRVESASSSHMLFVDAGADHVNINTGTDLGGTLNVNGSVVVSYSDPSIASLTIEDSGTSQAGLNLKAGSGSTNRATRVNFYNNVTSSSVPRWSILNDYYQNGDNGFWISDSAGNKFLHLNSNQLSAGSGNFIVNEDGDDIDFRVESDANAHALFMDSGASKVSINTGSTSNGILSVYSPTTYGKIFMSDSTLGYGYGAFIQGYGVTGSGGYFQLGSVDANTQTVAMQVNQQATAITFLTRDGAVGTSTGRLTLDQSGGNGAVFNEPGQDYDFRIESDAYSHIMFVDASENRVSIGHNSTAGYGSGHVLAVAGGSTIFSNFGEDVVMQIRGGNYTDPNTASILLSGGTGDNGYIREWYISSVASGGGGAIQNDLKFRRVAGGSATQYEALNLRHTGEVIVNDEGWGTHDFRVESDSNANALTVDAGHNSGKGAVIVGSSVMPETGVSTNVAGCMLHASDAIPMVSTGASWHFPSIPSNKQTQADRWKFGGFVLPYHGSNPYRADASESKVVLELPNGGVGGKTNLELCEIGANYGWAGGYWEIEVYETYYSLSGYKKYLLTSGPNLTLVENYGNNSISLSNAQEGPFQNGTSSVPQTIADQSYYRNTIRASYPAYRGGLIVLTVPSWATFTTNGAEVDNRELIRLLNPQ